MKLKDLKTTKFLKNIFSELCFSIGAQSFLCSIFYISQKIDDIFDKEEIDNLELYLLFEHILFEFKKNDFYILYESEIDALLKNIFYKWVVCNKLEVSKKINEITFCWRASIYDLILFVMYKEKNLIFIEENADLLVGIYGEKFEDYKREFLCQMQ